MFITYIGCSKNTVPTFGGFFNLYVAMKMLSNPLRDDALASMWSTNDEEIKTDHLRSLGLCEQERYLDKRAFVFGIQQKFLNCENHFIFIEWDE